MQNLYLFIYSCIILTIFSQNSLGQKNNNTFTDLRDGKTYKMVKIGNQTWMAENLNYKTNNSNWCYNGDTSNCNIYGGLYDWGAAQKVCPSGWHLPTNTEWTQLTDYLGGESIAGGKIKEAGTKHWKNSNIGANNNSGFTAIPGGDRNMNSLFSNIGKCGNWWSSTEDFADNAWSRGLNNNISKVNGNSSHKSSGFSVRCIYNNSNYNMSQTDSNYSLQPIIKDSFVDLRDSAVYKTVKIGSQIWMAENLNFATKSGSSCYNAEISNCNTYGRLYNWQSAKFACPSDWHLPSDEEWAQLIANFGYESVAGGKMKESGTTHWNSPNTDAVNSSGFTAIPGGSGYDNDNKECLGIRDYAYWWSSTENNNVAWIRYLEHNNSCVYRTIYGKNSFVFSVRCIHNDSNYKINPTDNNYILPPIIKESFKDSRDGTVYKTVKIGTQIWMAENLNYKTKSGSWCYNDEINNCNTYGSLYDWQTAKKVCPTGWHLPSNEEWTLLADNLGGENLAGGKMKESGTNHWNSPNKDADNSSSFTAVPGGHRFYEAFDYIGKNGNWWSSTEYNTINAWKRFVNNESNSLDKYNADKSCGFSIRCIKDL